jgi:hypothetical protein
VPGLLDAAQQDAAPARRHLPGGTCPAAPARRHLRTSSWPRRIGQSGWADRVTDGMMKGAERRRLMRARGSAGLAAVAVTVVALVTGCAGHGSPAASRTSASQTPADGRSEAVACGTTKTAANVPVQVQVSHGTVTCAAAMAIEKDYAKAIRSGSAPGNGGGGPVPIDGWTCQGFATPVVLRTGQASKCVHGAAEILAVLPLPA